ncbi:MAG: VPLPA-CTERM sorting domain-containing protein [Pseudomonadales bacterium]|nr:VPLPA-CTERM sorting domain-containing protein [Halioglobus sp.]MCP5129910.1 VPLPA-CTERM sorting domain-containing protein [Pseudomonadales bacterium]
MKNLLPIAALLVPMSISAAPIAYQGDISSGNQVTGTLVGSDGYLAENESGREWWTFSGTAGDVVDITAGRLAADLDLGFSLYFGTTAVDESLFSFESSFGGLTYLGFFDDNWGPNIPGPFADPQVLGYVLPSTGTYSLAVVSVLNGSECGTCDYALRLGDSVSPVPVPAAAWLFGSALLGLAGVKRKKA